MNKEKSLKYFSQKGQATIEFFFVVVIVLLVIMGVIGFSHMFFTYISVVSASREGARTGIPIGKTVNNLPYYKDCDVIREAVRRVGKFAGISDNQITITYDSGPGTSQFGNCPVTSGVDQNTSEPSTGNRIVVTVSIPYKPIVPFVPIRSNTISATTRYTIIK